MCRDSVVSRVDLCHVTLRVSRVGFVMRQVVVMLFCVCQDSVVSRDKWYSCNFACVEIRLCHVYFFVM